MSKRLFVNDLPSDTDIAKVPIRVPDDVFKNKNYTGPKTQIVHEELLALWYMGY